jgi:hypothetical protein
MKTCFLQNLAITVLFAGAMQAATITWDFSTGTVGNVGSSTEIFTKSGFSVTANGFASNTVARNLFGKAAGGDENGLGLVDTSDNELSGNNFIQLDLSALSRLHQLPRSLSTALRMKAGRSLTALHLVPHLCDVILTGNNEGTLNSISVRHNRDRDRPLPGCQGDQRQRSRSFADRRHPSVPEPSTVSLSWCSRVSCCAV